jgi:hypothetical protein
MVHGGLEACLAEEGSRYCQCDITHFFDQAATAWVAARYWVGGFS